MRNLNFFKAVVFLLFSFVLYPALAQKVILERNMLSDNTPIIYQSNFDKQKYNLTLNESGQKIYSLNNTTPTTIEEGQNDTNVIMTIETAQGSVPPAFFFLYDETGYFNFPMGNTINVPQGIYDIYISFFDSNGKEYIVIKELVNIQQDTTILADINEADRYINTKLYNENRELLEPGLYDQNTGETTGGNSVTILDRAIYFAPINDGISNTSSTWNMKFTEDEDPIWSFYINELSDRYSIFQNAIGLGNEGQLYFNKYETLTEVSENITVLENNPDDYVFHQQEFTSSPLGMNNNSKFLAFTTMDVINNKPIFGLTIYNPNNSVNSNEKFEAYLNNPLGDDISNFLIFPSVIDYIPTTGPFPNQGFYTIGNAVVKDNDQILYSSRSASTNGYFLGEFTYFDAELKALPFHPKFSFFGSEGINIGNNVPNAVTAFIENSLKTNYLGRYGEKRDSDFFETNVEVKQNNNIVFSGNYVNDGFIDYVLPSTGDFQVTFTNTNSNLEGIEGKNVTQLTFNRGLEDSTPPTLQQLQFRNTEGEVTDRFTTSSTGTVRLAAGDFKFNIDDLGYYFYDYLEGSTVEFYYSINNQNNWTELELTKYDEYFQMPGFGDYYEASLASIESTQENIWYDVRIICTDAAGNKQEQTISPAFKINDTMGTDEIAKTNFTVYPNPFSDNLNIQLPETIKGNVTFRVTDLTGKTLYSKEQTNKSFTWNGASLPKGVYILSIENNGKVIAKKVIKK